MDIIAVGGDDRESGPVLAPIAPPPGPISPPNCKVSGPGRDKGTAGIPVMINLNTFDANDRRIYDGGARVKLKAIKKEGEGTSGEIIEGTVRDNKDGTYLITYKVPDPGVHLVCAASALAVPRIFTNNCFT